MRIRKFKSRGGNAIILVLLVLVSVPLVLIGIYQYIQSKYRYLHAQKVASKLESLSYSGLESARNRLEGERFYDRDYGSYSIPSGMEDCSLTIYFQEFESEEKEYLLFPSPNLYPVLDHIKVFVKASFRDKNYYASAKWITSIRIKLGSTHFGSRQTESLEKQGLRVLRGLVHRRIFTEAELNQSVPGFKSLEDRESRKNFSDYLDSEELRFVKNSFTARKNRDSLSVRLERDGSDYPKSHFQQFLKGLSLGGGNDFDSSQLNLLIREGFLNFVGTINKTPSKEEIRELQKKHEIHLLEPQSFSNPFVKEILGKVFGDGHPGRLKKPREQGPFFYANSMQPQERFLLKRKALDYQNSHPMDFIRKFGQYHAGTQYEIQFSSNCAVIPEDKKGLELLEFLYRDFHGTKEHFQEKDCPGGPQFSITNKSRVALYGDYFIQTGEKSKYRVFEILDYFRRMVSGGEGSVMAHSYPLGPPSRSSGVIRLY